MYNPHIPCEIQGGHIWSEAVQGKNILEQDIKLVICINCGKVRSKENEES